VSLEPGRHNTEDSGPSHVHWGESLWNVGVELGSAEGYMSITESDIERFWSKVDKTDSCWLWTACKSSTQYGVIRLSGTTRYAHRISYYLSKGDLADGLVVDHLCRTRHCVNPDHLELVTNRENILRGNGWSGRNASKTSCLRGHPLTPDNLTGRTRPGRECKQCRDGYRRKSAESVSL